MYVNTQVGDRASKGEAGAGVTAGSLAGFGAWDGM